VRGPGFFRLHAAFETQYKELILAADDLAERMRALGANAPSSIIQLSALSSLSENTPLTNDDEVITSLRNDHLTVAKKCRETARAANDALDEPTADLLIARATAHEKTAWMLSATLGE
jgi:starvation-inducible DNA-binding protein